MTEPVIGERGTKRIKKSAGVTGEGSYRPHRKAVTEERSPYLIRSTGAKCPEEGDTEAEAEVLRAEEEAVMARRGDEESTAAALLQYLRERDAQDREERAQAMELQRLVLEQEKERHRLAEERLIARREEDEQRRRDEEETRRTLDDERRCKERHEDTRVRERRELLNERLKGLGMYKEGSELNAYLSKFERIMRMGDVSEDSWGDRLYPKLTETLCKRMTKDLDSEASYEIIKEGLLKAVGETAITYGNNLLSVNSDMFKAMTAGGIADWLVKTTSGMFRGCNTVEDCTVAVALAVLRRVLPESGKVFVDAKKIGEWGNLRDALEDWMSGRQPGNYFKSLGSGPTDSSSRGYRNYKDSVSTFGQGGKTQGHVGDRVGGNTSGVRGGFNSGFLVKCYSCGEIGHRANECKRDKAGSSLVARVPTCYVCGKVGHKSPECTQKSKGTTPVKKEPPTKLSVLRRAESEVPMNVARGKVCGVHADILIDSGAELASVPRELVPKGVVWESDVIVRGYGGVERSHRCFMCEFEIGGYRKLVKTVVDESEAVGVACIVPVSLVDEEEATAYREAIRSYKCDESKRVNVLTRSMARKEAESDRCHEGVESSVAWDVVVPEGEGSDRVHEPEDPVSSHPDPLIMPETLSKVGEGHGADDAEGAPEADQPQAKAGEESVRGRAVPLEGLRGSDSVCQELGQIAAEIGPVREGQDKLELIKEIKEDSSLSDWRELADRNDRGFKWSKGVLVRELYVSWEEFREVIVLSRSLRNRVLVLGHDRNGHLGADKVSRLIGRYFVWPCMAKDIIDYCGSCERCQLRSKHRPRRAPAVDRPVLSEPFEQVAIDLVGPLPKGKGGCRFILTYVCLATRWPEAVPLRSITAKAVVEGLWSIFSRTSVPEVVLSDQGSQFCGKVMNQLCSWLGVEKVRTSPYHPESNGCVERMHGTLKAVLGKCIDENIDWVDQLNFVLFVLREMPHKDSGFSPFDLVYGFRVRTPLDALYHGLYECDSSKLSVNDWVLRMSERLEAMRDSAALGMAKGKESRMQYLNRGTKLREFKEGDRVLYRVPGMTCKMSDSWQGPYLVIKRVGAVNYRIARIGKIKHSKVVHVNCLKCFKARVNINRLDVVIEEESESKSVLKGVCEGFVQSELDTILSDFDDVFSDKPGNTDKVVMSIETTGEEPVRQVPYSVPLGIREKVREEIASLENQGIIERCQSKWASPLVPVRKPDGSLRLCVDYRKLNQQTVKEPYYIPSFNEMVEKVGGGRVLSKIDLAKGFHQVVVKVEDRDKTSFICPFGKYRYIRMPFGLTNAPSVFQRLMEEVLVDCNEFSRVYIDDILVVSSCWEEHVCHLRKVLEVLREAGLTCKRTKCQFGKRTLEFLGHQIGDGKVSVPAARVAAIKDHPVPQTRKQLRAFLGLVGFYRRFVPGFHRWSSVLTPHTSTAMSGRVSWTSVMLDAFRALCNSLSASVCLHVPCVSDVFVLDTDASGTGVGAVLSVVRRGEKLPVAFFSRQLQGAQKSYSAQELEGLGVYESVRHFAYFLYGRHFTVVTDHKGLIGMMLKSQENRRIMNWSLKLSMFNFTIVYRAGADNVVADNLSRCGDSSDVSAGSTSLILEGGDVGISPHDGEREK